MDHQGARHDGAGREQGGPSGPYVHPTRTEVGHQWLDQLVQLDDVRALSIEDDFEDCREAAVGAGVQTMIHRVDSAASTCLAGTMFREPAILACCF
mmetsp:Transcript_40601/g.130634  ORF Transcript_40601/g.130634 Transcript_40601/m.130634 type:complete len:96 (+) Transcript_40601:597-884(+)